LVRRGCASFHAVRVAYRPEATKPRSAAQAGRGFLIRPADAITAAVASQSATDQLQSLGLHLRPARFATGPTIRDQWVGYGRLMFPR
jgi:hypothetical protein